MTRVPDAARAALIQIEQAVGALRDATRDDPPARWTATTAALHLLVGRSASPTEGTLVGDLREDRRAAARTLTTSGWTHTAIAGAAGISVGRVSQILGSDRLADAAGRVTLAAPADQLPLPAPAAPVAA